MQKTVTVRLIDMGLEMPDDEVVLYYVEEIGTCEGCGVRGVPGYGDDQGVWECVSCAQAQVESHNYEVIEGSL